MIGYVKKQTCEHVLVLSSRFLLARLYLLSSVDILYRFISTEKERVYD
ncbi:hypothetical protein DET59_101126 [Rossellomorea aquimaris]|uniref:Uncharacterized protein n=1 Tax=Rossellomorea aquimaris TaxID=189382 RepID=A0A366F197_9BACI|nr:hypothetical protein DET59_101126 [Rossellomorea aquimaris]